MWIAIGIVAIIGFIVLNRFVFVPMMGGVPDNLGWRGTDEGFRRCPGLPKDNCVSSTAPIDNRSYITPIAFSGSVAEAKTRLLDVISEMPRHTILANEDNYVHVEFRSLTMGYPDDTEFYFDAESGVIQVRSAARLGGSDMGVNRRRVENIRTQFEG